MQRAQRILWWLLALLLLGVLVAGTAYITAPSWLPAVATRLLAPYGYELVELKVSRPALTHIDVVHLALRKDDVELEVDGATLTYSLTELTQGYLQNIQIARVAIAVPATPTPATPQAAFDWSALPKRLDPAAWLAALPWNSLRIAQLDLTRQALQAGMSGDDETLTATGHLHQTTDRVELRLAATAPDAARGYALTAAFQPDTGLTVEFFDATTASPFVVLDSQLAADNVAVQARVTLADYATRLVASLFGYTDAAGKVALSADTILPWPPSADFNWQDLVIEGTLAATGTLPMPAQAVAQVSAQSWSLENIVGNFTVAESSLALELRSGVIGFTDRLAETAAEFTVASPVTLHATTHSITVSEGLTYQLLGGNGRVTGGLRVFDYQTGGDASLPGTSTTVPAKLTARFDFDARFAHIHETGSMQLALEQTSDTLITTDGTVLLTSALFKPDPIKAPSGTTASNLALPFNAVYHIDSERFDVTFDNHRWRWRQPLMRYLLPDPERTWELTRGRLSYSGSLSWAPASSAAIGGATSGGLALQLTGKWTDVKLQTGAADAPYDLRPTDATFDLKLQGDQLKLAGKLKRGALVAPFTVRHNLTTGVGNLTSDSRNRVSAKLFANLFTNWREPYDLVSGELAVTAQGRWLNQGEPVLDATVRIDDARASYADYVAEVSNARFKLNAQGDNYSATDGRVEIGLFNPGVPITRLTAGVSAELNPAREWLTITQASAQLLGGSATAQRVEVNIAALSSTFDVQLTGLALADILALEGTDVAGAGVLNGSLRVELLGGEVTIPRGTLTAAPPGGYLRLNPSMTRPTGQPGLDFALTALADFTYETLNGDVSYQPNGDLQLGIQLLGRNPAVERGRAIRYNLNVSENIPALLNSLQADRALTDKVEQKLNRR